MRPFILILTTLQLIFAGLLFGGLTDVQASRLVPQNNHHRVEQVIGALLSHSHYQKKAIDDSLSSHFFQNYLDALDGNHLYFTKSDVESFEKHRYLLDDYLQRGNLSLAYDMFNLFVQRFHERMDFVQQRLDRPFDFSKNEYLELDRSKLPWPATSAELDSVWRKRIKNDALKLKLAGKETDEISKTLKKRYKNMLLQVDKSESEDVFQIYMNALAETFDPHTSYMSPKTSDDFKIRMSHSLEGIGATLRTEDEYTKVVQIVPGGPADRSGLLHPNDRISAVGQGTDNELVDVIGWRIDDVVQLIRGPKDTRVQLQILKADAPVGSPPDTITILRDKVRLADRAATSDTLEIEQDGRMIKVGVIDIPDFYFDYEAMRKHDPDYASTTKDVKRLIGELQSAGVESIIIDLRNNGGGFLTEAINLTGLFIKDGPVVQVRQTNGQVEVDRDNDSRVYYEGPLAVLINRFSASASEIFAAAIQDYGRGLIIGNQSFGKGTVQNIVGLNRFFSGSQDKLGQLKLTIAKFYRVNGGSTQNVGVIPDVEFPSQYHDNEVGERNMPNALLWDEIGKLSYEKRELLSKELTKQLRDRHAARVSTNLRFRQLIDNFNYNQKKREQTRLSLNEEVRRQLRKEAEARKEAQKKEREANGIAEKDGDLYLTEAAFILDDFIRLTRY